MNKKQGFTLSEVLITLGILGVVAALTTPSLNSSVQKNKVGPTLRKMISTMENAHERMLVEAEEDILSAIHQNDTDKYLEAFSKQVQGVSEGVTLANYSSSPAPRAYNGQNANCASNDADRNKVFTFHNGDAIAIRVFAPEVSAGHEGTSYKGYTGKFWYDLNGFKKGPNRAGKDEFLFNIDDSGAVYPDGGFLKQKLQGADASAMWNTKGGWGACNETTVTYGTFCGASIVDNDFKVIYKY